MSTQAYRGNSIAVILPCFNEAPAIARVVADFRAAFPEAAIYVFDEARKTGFKKIYIETKVRAATRQ